MNWHIEFFNPTSGKKFKLLLLSSVVITASVENLCDFATIELPEAVLNQVLKIEDKISRGTEVIIDLGYNDNLVREFTGYVTQINNTDSALKIECEDSIFKFRKSVANEVLVNTSVSAIVNRMIEQIDPSFKLICNFDISYSKFTIYQSEAFDILKKLQEETKANIYFDNENKTLVIDAPFRGKRADVKLAMDRNVESSSLEYKRGADRKVKVTIEGIAQDGQVTQVTSGNEGGESVNIKAPMVALADLQKIADAEHLKRSADRYSGTTVSWLLPVIRPTDTLHFSDPDYPERSSSYYAVSVVTSLSESGGSRTTQFGIKLGA